MSRTAAATAGATLALAVLTIVVATSQWRPTGPLVAVGVVLLAVPAAAGAGSLAALRLAGHDDAVATARLTAAAAPVMALFTQFAITAIASTRAPGLQQGLAIVLGGAGAAAIAARFTGVPER